MAGKGTLSPHQTPQYGDKVALERLQTNTTSPMSNAPVPRRGAGRPSGGQGTQQPVSTGAVPQQARDLMKKVARATKTLMYFQAVNAALDDDETRMFLLDAKREFLRASEEIKTGTPDWEL